ncbi:MAG: acyl dehydratase [Pseudomonadota bacterium]
MDKTTIKDLLEPARANALLASLGQSQTFETGDALPPFFHQIFFWEAQRPDTLGRDGHPRVGGLIPDMGLPRRMWAGGHLQFHAPLRLGSVAEKTTEVVRATRKIGRSGPLGFVTLRHDISQAGQLCVTEHQDLIYREDNTAPVTPPTAEAPAEDVVAVTFDTTLLFRYSALTFNGHRIHYDLDYAKSVEGYDNLVVHGPLLGQLLMLHAEDALGPLGSFSFRATSALTLGRSAQLCRSGATLWVESEGRQLHMTAEAKPKT